MNDPVEICMNVSGHVIAKTKGQFPTFELWHVVGKISSSSASVELYIADQIPPAFVTVNIDCRIPAEAYSKRLVAAQTQSTEWHEDDHPGILMIEHEIGDMLKGESHSDNYIPTFAFMTLYSNSNEASRALKIRFQEILCEFDVTNTESLDYESITGDILKNIEAVHKVLLWIRKSDEQEPEEDEQESTD